VIRPWLKAWWPALGYMAAIFALSSISDFSYLGPKIMWQLVFDFDKVAHALLYGGLAVLVLRATQRPVLSLLITFLYGVSDEVHQYFVPGRSMSIADGIADLAGAGITCGVWYWRRK
jgi:VanZ family protein